MVAGDRVEPWLEGPRLEVALADRLIDRQKGVLMCILAFLPGAQDPAAEREDAAAVAVEQLLEGGLVATTEKSHEPLIGKPCE